MLAKRTITGGGSGIGQFMAGTLAQAGADIIVVGQRRDRLEETIAKYGGKFVCLDIAEKGAAGRLAQKVTELQAAPNIIVNAAGINPRKHADEVTEQEWTESVHPESECAIFSCSVFYRSDEGARVGTYYQYRIIAIQPGV